MEFGHATMTTAMCVKELSTENNNYLLLPRLWPFNGQLSVNCMMTYNGTYSFKVDNTTTMSYYRRKPDSEVI